MFARGTIVEKIAITLVQVLTEQVCVKCYWKFTLVNNTAYVTEDLNIASVPCQINCFKQLTERQR